MSTAAERFVAGCDADGNRIDAALTVRKLLRIIATNWGLLLRTYEGPGK